MSFVICATNSSYAIVSSRDLQASHSRDRAGGATADHVSFLCFGGSHCIPSGVVTALASSRRKSADAFSAACFMVKLAVLVAPLRLTRQPPKVPSAPRESLNLRNAAFNSQGITFPCRLHARRWIVIMHAIISPGAKATSVSGSCTQTCAHLRTCSEGLVSRG